MRGKQKMLQKMGLAVSVASLFMTAGCSIWQDEGPERYGLAPGPKRIPAFNPGGKLAQQAAVPQVQQAAPAPVMQAPMSPMPPVAYAPQTMIQQPYAPPPVAYAPAPAAMPPAYMQNVAPPPAPQAVVDGASRMAMSELPAVAAPPPTLPPVPAPQISAPVAAPEVAVPMDLSSTTLNDRGFPSLARVPQAPAASSERMINAQQAANELQQELTQSQVKSVAANQQMLADSVEEAQQAIVEPEPVIAPNLAIAPAPPALAEPVAEAPNVIRSATTGRFESLDSIDRRFAAPRDNTPWEALQPTAEAGLNPWQQPASYPATVANISAPETDMTAITPAYEFPAPAAAELMDVAPSTSSVEVAEPLPPIKLVPPAEELEYSAPAIAAPVAEPSGAIALEVPPMQESVMPAPPELPAARDIFVPAPPQVADVSSVPSMRNPAADAIQLTAPAEAFSGRSEGFLPESRYEKRRRFQRRKLRF